MFKNMFMGMLKSEFCLREGGALGAVLRADAIHECVDDVLDFCDHFASNRIHRGWTLAGVGEFFLKNIFT